MLCLGKVIIFLYELWFCSRHETNSDIIQVPHFSAKGGLEIGTKWTKVNAFFLHRIWHKLPYFFFTIHGNHVPLCLYIIWMLIYAAK